MIDDPTDTPDRRRRIDSGEARRIATKLGHLATSVLACVDGVTPAEGVALVADGAALVAAIRRALED